MNDTPLLKLPLVQPAQAQKHVTVNEALIRLDGLTQLRLQSRTFNEPPSGAVVDGDCYSVASGATGEWHGREGLVAIGSNGGWVFAQPLSGWRAWIVDEHCAAVFVNGGWNAGWLAGSQANAALRIEVLDADYSVAAGAGQDTSLLIPADSIVLACSARISEPLTGTLTAWELGIPGDTARFGTGMTTSTGSYCTGILSQPTAFYTDTPVTITPIGGTFNGGRLRLALHCYRISLPE